MSVLLGNSRNMKQQIEAMYASLPIQSDLDLKLRAPEMIELSGKKAGAWVKEMQTQMVIEIIHHRLKNEKEALIDFMKKRLKN